MKRNAILMVLVLLGLFVNAQQKLIIKGKANAQYIEHKVGEKESLSSIGRLYGVTASQLARFNGRSPSSVLSKGIVIKVPFNVSGLQQKAGGLPVYHVIAKGDNLFKISQQYNKVPVSQLRNWNKLGNAAVKNGQSLIVGYLKITTETQTQPETVAVEKNVDPVPETIKPVTVQKTEPIQPAKKEDNGDFHKDSVDNIATDVVDDEGFFASLYVRNDLTLTQRFRSGDAATFKTISGWTDRKYYVMINDITPGTIVRITASNNKSVCARVLAPLPVIKGEEALLLRMNNAAASALGMKETQFTVTIAYFE